MAKSDQTTPPTLSRTPLFELSVAQKARMTEFSGWEMPVQYEGLKQEHQQVRTSVGMFDISHMGKFYLKGSDLISELEYLVSSSLSNLQPGQAQYTVLLNPQGGIIDDIIFYYQGKNSEGLDQGIMIVNAGTATKDKNWLNQHLKSELSDRSLDRVLIAVQGPEAVNKLQSLVEEDLSDLPAFGHITTTIASAEAFIARTGYTGEDGFEIMLPPESGQNLWRSLLSAGVTPCGLGARDTLRLEAAMALYGQDLDETITPLEAGLNWLVHLDTKGDFIGRDKLEAQKSEGVSRRLVGLVMEGRQIARHDYPLLYQDKVVGKVTSGTLSPTLNKAIALAYLPTPLSKIGQEIQVEIRGKTYPAKVVKKPFYRKAAIIW
ncbi:glycine cleavage system aminomethyltransferase GcvT [Gloeocapsa sp. PCC 73106]|uniref:glycine cleavage system aminomethyltransferase GcvT n=1 Tax=Gloeocapsa sp. PCC 73106 TaxID=102232 RepID=UPI0002AC5414|nr:glycine cleavage system aminomethyltransferase GcvT [Gloeocapsa sp. PCC 73106]ELR99242.1 glycine cleavage system T protein [Gloeocapsa sp. PCC 73106]